MEALRDFKTHPQGFLVALEGIDGSGKTTQTEFLKKLLISKGYPVLTLKEPTAESSYGKIIRSFSSHNRPDPAKELELFVMDRDYDVKTNILPALQEGKIVIIDRYIPSNMFYQGALGIDLETIARANLNFPWPDLIIILDLDVSKSLERLQTERQINPVYETDNYLNQVKNIVDSLVLPNAIKIQADKLINSISTQIMELILEGLKIKFPTPPH
jgi:dTMP kinase